MPRAAIDIGSNSLLLLVVRDDGAVLHDESVVVGLGKGLGDRGLFRPDRMDEALAVLTDFAGKARAMGVPPYEVAAVATSAARRALNARAFLDRVKDATGFVVQVVSGEEEARLTWAGALAGLDLAGGSVAVVDLGGGSTEIVMAEAELTSMRVSLELGSVRLTERFFGAEVDRVNPADLARLRAKVAEALDGLAWPVHPRALVAVGGTVTTLACMEQGLTAWDRSRVHGYRLSRNALRRWIDVLLGAGADQRRALAATSPERADFLLAGACVLEAVCTSARRDSLRVSDGGVRHGLLASHR